MQPSEIANSHPDCGRVQDPYSLHCMPQVCGSSRTAWRHLNELTEIEINAVTDNPIILGSHVSISGGNFHGQPLALPIDYAMVAAAELGNTSDRRCYLINEGRYGLLKMLIANLENVHDQVRDLASFAITTGSLQMTSMALQ